MMGAATEKARLPRFSFVLGIERENADRGGNWVKLYTKLAAEETAPLDRLTKTWRNTVPADMHCGCWSPGHPEPSQKKGLNTNPALKAKKSWENICDHCTTIHQKCIKQVTHLL